MYLTLCVKDGPHAETIALAHLNAWFTEGGHDAPFPPGTLLHYSVARDRESTSMDDKTREFVTRADDAYLLRLRASESAKRYQIWADGIAWMDADGREVFPECEAEALAAMLAERQGYADVQLHEVTQ